jgi:hypothetical protein
MRLELIAPDGTALDLNPGTRVQLNLVNSAFDSDVLKGSFSYTFAIPNTPKNRIYFGFPEEISSNAGFTNAVSGFRLKSGMVEVLCKVNIQSVSPDAINIYLYTASAILADTLKTKKLRELDYGPADEINPDEDDGHLWFLITLPTDELRIYIQSGATWYYHGIYHGNTLTRAECIRALAQRINRPEIILPQEWVAGTPYLASESRWVFRGSLLYRCKADTTGDDPNFDSEVHWEDLGSEFDYETTRNSMAHRGWDYYDVETDPKDYTVIPVNSNYLFSNNPFDGPGSTYMLPGGTYWLPSDNRDICQVLLYMWQKAMEDPHEGDLKVFPIRDEKFHSEFVNIRHINYWKDGGFMNEAVDGQPPLVQNAFVPMLRFVTLVEAMHSFLGYEIDTNNFIDKDFFKSLVAYCNQTAERIVSKEYDGTAQFDDRFANIINKEFFTPDVTLADFINGFRAMFFMGCWFDYFQKRIKYKPLRDVLTDFANAIDISALVPSYDEISFTDPDGFTLAYTHDGSDSIASSLKEIQDENVKTIDPVDDLGDLPTAEDVGIVCLVTNLEQYFISYRDEAGTLLWKSWSPWLQSKKIGNGTTVITPKCSTLPNWIGTDGVDDPANYKLDGYNGGVIRKAGDYVADPERYRVIKTTPYFQPLDDEDYYQPLAPRTWRIPYAGMARKSGYYQKAQLCTLRLLSYAGVVQNPEDETDTDLYPLATCDLYSAVGVKYPGQYGGSLRWEGEYGLYNQFAKPWLDFLSKAKQATIQIPVTESLLNQMKPWLLLKIRNHYFVWSNLTVDFPIDSGLAKITIHRL